MGEGLHRIAYEATVDDAVDVSLRLANRSEAFRKQIRQNVAIAGCIGGLALFAVWMSYLSEWTAFDVGLRRLPDSPSG